MKRALWAAFGSSDRDERARIAVLCLLLCAALLEPAISSTAFEFPAITNAWALAPFAALFLLPLADFTRPWRLLNLDLAFLLLPVVSLALEKPPRQWPVATVYVCLAYLAVRMVLVAHGRRPASAPRIRLGRGWLVLGLVVLAAGHTAWAIQSRSSSDVGEGGVHGALRIVEGKSLYGSDAEVKASPASHTDTYGPANYEAYIPFAAAFGGKLAARLTAAFFDLLTGLLLLLLGRRSRDTTTGLALAFCWMAFPFTLYDDALGFNDSLVACALVGTILLAQSPGRRGAAAAVAVWAKLSPLALIPVLAGYRARGSYRRALAVFGLAVLAMTAVLFLPAFAHSTPATFISRTFGFQAGREPAHSLWSIFASSSGALSNLSSAVVAVMHGCLAAAVAALVILSFRLDYQQDLCGLAAISAAVLASMQLVLSYFAYSYLLWFAPLVLFALLSGSPVASEAPRDEAPLTGSHPGPDRAALRRRGAQAGTVPGARRPSTRPAPAPAAR